MDTDDDGGNILEFGSEEDEKGSGKDRPSGSSSQADSKIEESFSSPSKQLTLAKILEKQGSPVEIIRRSSPGAKKQPSLLEVLFGKVKDDEAKAKEDAKRVRLEGVAGEKIQQEEIKNGSRDRHFLVEIDTFIIRSMAANIVLALFCNSFAIDLP